MRRTIFRDRETGRFAARSTWRRSKSHGGTRYVRQRIAAKPKPKARAKPRPKLEVEGPVEEREIRAALRRIEEEEEGEFEPFELEGSADYEEP